METPVVFECKGQQIVGMLHLPEGRGRFPAALLLHGFTGTKSEAHRMYVKLSRALANHGVASLRFDFRGCGDSAGDFEDLSIRSEVTDAVEAVRFLARHRRVNSRRLALVGLSMGGAVASYLVGRERTRFKTLALWAPVADGSGILDGFSTPEAVAALAETGITDHAANLVGVQFIRQFAEMKPLREIVKSRCPVLLIHGARDEVVPAHNSDQYEKVLLTHKRIVKKVIITGADHTFNRHVWEQRAIAETVDWLSETLQTGGMAFQLVSKYKPRGDQPSAIKALTDSLVAGNRFQTLLGVTGSGKTFTMANVIQALDRPTLVISHNKTLAAQLFSEFKQFFPHNAVEYFVSYYDYYQPEAYIPQTDTFIEKDSSINEQLEKLRLSTTSSLLSRRDVVVVASVSCIYGLGSPEDYHEMMAMVKVDDPIGRDDLLRKLVDMQYNRNDIEFTRGNFRVRGDTVEVCPSYTEDAVRIQFDGDRVEHLSRFDPLTGKKLADLGMVSIYPAKHWVTPYEKIVRAVDGIKAEMVERVAWFEQNGKLLEAQRIHSRTMYDLEMLKEMGFCSGIENYTRHLSGRAPGERPGVLIDFLPKDFLLIVDESHVTIPQIGGMSAGDRSRKNTLVEHGFRLPSALDNRPLTAAEFESLIHQCIFVSATPGATELGKSAVVAEQIIRPTGLVDPPVTVKPLTGQIDDLIEECRKRVEKHERILVTTLTKRTSEDLTDYLKEVGLRVKYLHSEIDAIERVEVLRGLRAHDFDVLVGINLLREGLDLPEVSLVAILDADKEGFLRSATSLIQTAGRAARHINAEVILYADVMTDSIKKFIATTEYRRTKQLTYNKEHHITPKTVKRELQLSLAELTQAREVEASVVREAGGSYQTAETLRELEAEMIEAAENLQFEKAAILRDQIAELKKGAGPPPRRDVKYDRKLQVNVVKKRTVARRP